MTTYCRQHYTRTSHCDVTVVYVMNGWSIAVSRRRKVAGRLKYEPIGLSHDGDLIRCITPAKTAEKLRELQKEGYSVPDTAIAQLDDEWMPAS
jgi:hypothetical protein